MVLHAKGDTFLIIPKQETEYKSVKYIKSKELDKKLKKVLKYGWEYGNIAVLWNTEAYSTHAQIAQLVEQRTENPRVAGSIPALGIPLNAERHKC